MVFPAPVDPQMKCTVGISCREIYTTVSRTALFAGIARRGGDARFRTMSARACHRPTSLLLSPDTLGFKVLCEGERLAGSATGPSCERVAAERCESPVYTFSSSSRSSSTMLALGNGLPGIAHALGDAAAHVCTCASGGDHAACRVCNPTLTAQRPSRRPAAQGAPCGGRRFATTAPSDETTTLPSPIVGAAIPTVRLDAPRAQAFLFDQARLEPPIPPPRIAWM